MVVKLTRWQLHTSGSEFSELWLKNCKWLKGRFKLAKSDIAFLLLLLLHLGEYLEIKVSVWTWENLLKLRWTPPQVLDFLFFLRQTVRIWGFKWCRQIFLELKPDFKRTDSRWKRFMTQLILCVTWSKYLKFMIFVDGSLRLYVVEANRMLGWLMMIMMIYQY